MIVGTEEVELIFRQGLLGGLWQVHSPEGPSDCHHHGHRKNAGQVNEREESRS